MGEILPRRVWDRIENCVSNGEANDPQFGYQATLLDTVRRRYGFDPETLTAYQNHPEFDAKLDSWKVRRLFLDTTSTYELPGNQEIERHLQNFARFLAGAACPNSEERPPSGLWDLSPSHARYLGKQVTSVTVIERACFVDGDRSNLLRKRTLFSLKVKEGEPAPWTLFVEDPSVAVECLRWDFESTYDVASALLLRGTPFYTASELVKPAPQQNKYDFKGLGLRNGDYEPDLADFVMYETEYLRFVQTPREEQF